MTEIPPSSPPDDRFLQELASTSLGTPEAWRIISLADIGAVADTLGRGEMARSRRSPDRSVLAHLARHTVTSWGIEWTSAQVKAVREFIDGLRESYENPRFRNLRRPIPGIGRNRFDFVLDIPDHKPDPTVCDGKKWAEGGQRVVTRAVTELATAFPAVGRPVERNGKRNLQQEFHRLYQALSVAEKLLCHVELSDPGVHHTICVVDVDRFDRSDSRTRPDHVAMHSAMYDAVQSAFVEAGLPWEDCFKQDVGDSILTTAPATVPKGAFTGPLLHALTAAVRAHNESHPAEERIRLRLALHAGEVAYDENGLTGSAIIHAFRLLGAKPLKDTLPVLPGALAVIASDWFYTEVIRHDRETAPDAYRRILVNVKEFSDVGWIRLFDHEPLREAATPPHTATDLPAMPRPGSEVFYELVAALDEIPCMRGEHSRAIVVDTLSFGGYVRYAPSRIAHITSILHTCLESEDRIADRIAELVRVIASQEPTDSITVKRLLTLLMGDA